MSTLQAYSLREALVAAARDASARSRAVSALRGSEVLAATWPTDPELLRTLQNSSGVRALALFTDRRQLEDAALRFAWHDVEGQVPTRALHISEAIRFARRTGVTLVIVDIASDHALELDEGEMELVAAPPSSRPPSFRELVPPVSSPRRADGTDVKRVSTRPPAPGASLRDSAEAHPSASGLQPAAINVDVEKHAVSATFAAATTATMAALETAPPPELVDALTQVLREYCEVDWACLVGEADQHGVAVALRIEPSFRSNLPQISAKLREAGHAQGASCDVLVLDTMEQMKRARALGQPFYPWRKR